MTDPLAAALERLASVLERIEEKLDAQATPETGSKQEAARVLGISPRTLERRIDDQELQPNVHYWHEGGKIVFDLPLLRDWQRNRHNPIAHQRAIEVRRQQLPSAKKKRR
jgi:hypothetical protein